MSTVAATSYSSSASRLRIFLLLVCLIAITFLAYYNSLSGDFLVDDDKGILYNHRIHNLSNYFSHFHLKLGMLIEMVSVLIWHFSPVQPFGFHLYSVGMYCVCVMLSFILCRMLFSNVILAFLTSLLFAVHPIHTEVVSWISANNYVTSGVFYFAVFIFFLKALQKKIYFLFCFGMFIFGIFFSREAAMVLLMFFVYGVFAKPKELLNRKYFFILYILWGTLATITTLCLYDVWADRSSFHWVILQHRGPHYLVVSVKAFAYYLYILFFPLHRGLFHSFGFTSTHTQDISPLFFISLGLMAGLIFAMIMSRKKIPAVSFGIAWFFATFLPYSNLIPICNLVSERYLFLPSFGFCLVLSALFLNAWKIINRQQKLRYVLRGLALALLTVFLLSYALMTIKRNFQYANKAIYWETNIKNFPDGYELYNNLAGTFFTLGRFDKAMAYCEILLSVNPYQQNVWVNKGRVFEAMGNKDKARECYAIAVRINPNNSSAKTQLDLIAK